MITTLKERECFIIRANFVTITFHQGILRIEQTTLKSLDSAIFFAEVTQVPHTETHLFNSVRHIYNFLIAKPECIIQMTQEMFKYVVTVNGISHICYLALERLKLNDEELWIKKNTYQISIKMHQLKVAQQQVHAQSLTLKKKLKEENELFQTENQKIKQIQNLETRLLQDIKEKRQTKVQLEQSLRRKQEILTQIKKKEGAFVALDD